MNPITKQRIQSLGRHWVLAFLVFEALFFSLATQGFFAVNTVQIVLFYGSLTFLLATAELFVIVTGGIDLSVGYVMGLATVVFSKLTVAFVASGLGDLPSLLLGLGCTLVIGIIPGLVNGLLVAKLRVPPFIATFAMLGAAHGVSELLLEGSAAKNLPALAGTIGNGHFVYFSEGAFSFFQRPLVARGVNVVEILPNVVVLAFLFIIVCAFLLKRTRFGRHVYAIGGNKDAAVRSGINVDRRLIQVYVLGSLLASVAGIIYVLMYITGKADAGASLLLDSIAAVVIGGASLFGGSGTVWRTILGCLVIAVLETGLRMMGTPTFDLYIFVGVILIFAVIVERFFPDFTKN